jgi:hypothetical protein
MPIPLRFVLALLVSVATLPAQEPVELVIEQAPFRVYSAFWMNLHDVLWAEAWARRPATAEKEAGTLPEPLNADLAASERQAWANAVAYYDNELADLNPVFEMAPIRIALMRAEGSVPTGLSAGHQQALSTAPPVYRKHWWPAHDRANRAWAADVFARVASLSPAVPDRIARLSGTPWLSQGLRVDVVRAGLREGAATSIQPAPGHVTVSSGNPNLQGWSGAEVVLHEATHLIYIPVMDAFAAELRAQGKDIRTGPIQSWNANVWHAAMFYMTGKIVSDALAQRGITYEPYLGRTGLLERAWPQFRGPLDAHWRPYVDGATTDRMVAIKQTIAALK